MKRSYVFVVIILMMAVSPNVLAGMGLRYGIKGGMSFADQTWKYSNSLGEVGRDRRKGLIIGAFADWSPTPLFGFRPEVLYVQKGNQLKVQQYSLTGTPISNVTYKDRIDYLSLLATAKLQFGGGPLGFYLLGGPRLDLKLSANSDYPGPGMQSILDSYTSTVPGLTFGVGIQSAIGSLGPVMVEARYDYDTRYAARHVSQDAVLEIDNKAFLILFGLLF